MSAAATLGTVNSPKISITLSGGGLRAAAFHLGVLARLAVSGDLERVREISTVSGGSICTAAVFGPQIRWPTSNEFLKVRYAQIRSLMTTVDLLSLRSVGWQGLLHFGTDILFHRAKILAEHLRSLWGVEGELADLPETPRWIINSTNLSTGKNWRFTRDEMGDWVHGRHRVPRSLIAEAVAASAAVPYVIGALRLRVSRHNWYVQDPATKARLSSRSLMQHEIRLWDGGVYENLGLEAVYKPGVHARGRLLIVSDASGELGPSPGNPLVTLLRGHLAAPRLFDIAADQNRALRSRMLIRDIDQGRVRGALLRMGNSTHYIHTKAGALLPAEAYAGSLSEDEIENAFRFPVDLAAIPSKAFDLLVRHGYEVADATLTTYLSKEFQTRHALPF